MTYFSPSYPKPQCPLCRQCQWATPGRCIYGGPFTYEPSAAERQRMAAYLNLNPNDPTSWPIQTLDHLIRLESRKGRQALLKELNDIMTPPRAN
jgi:hypothetical protein